MSALAREMDTSRSTLYAYLDGTTLPNAVMLDRLLIALDVPAEERKPLTSARDRFDDAMRRRRKRSPRGEEDGAEENTTVLPRPFQLPGVSALFFGRDQELAMLADLIRNESARGGATTIVIVSGMPGVGKTSRALWTMPSRFTGKLS